MFNLLMSGGGWEPTHGSMSAGRTLEYTRDDIKALYMPEGMLDLTKITTIPTVFASETQGDNSQPLARVGMITRARLIRKEYELDYALDPEIPSISNTTLERLAGELDIDASTRGINEFQRTHWSIKEPDLFRVLLKAGIGTRPKPKVFNLTDEGPDRDLLAVMMPFAAEFRPVYKALQTCAAAAGMRCQRADDIWIADHVIQDVVTLLCRASVVVCDLTGRNANVFYEMGIAHVLAREVIIITQDAHDVPFDVAHIRHVRYLRNREGLKQLREDVQRRLETLRART